MMYIEFEKYIVYMDIGKIDMYFPLKMYQLDRKLRNS